MAKSKHKSTSKKIRLGAVGVVGVVALYAAGASAGLVQSPTALLAAVAGSSSSSALTVVSPNGAEEWAYGTLHDIKWTGGSKSWKINVLLNNATKTKTIKTLQSVGANTGSLTWKVPADLPVGEYSLRVACQNCPTGTTGWFDDSNGTFRIVARATPGVLEVTESATGPDAGMIIVDPYSETFNVTLQEFLVKPKFQDATIRSLSVTLKTSDNNLSDVISGIELVQGTTVLASKAAPIGSVGVVTFDNLNQTLNKDVSAKYRIIVDLKPIVSYAEGTTLSATTPSAWNAVDTNNVAVAQPVAKEGVVQTLMESGIMLTLIATDATNSSPGTGSNDDQGTFKIKYKIAAIGADTYVSSLANATLSGGTPSRTSIKIDRAGTPLVNGVSVVLSDLTDTDLTPRGNYLIKEGSQETFELTATVKLPTSGLAGLYRAALGAVSWSKADVYPLSKLYTWNLELFKTSYLGLN